MFVADAEALLEKRRIERDLIEGIKELNDQDLRSALSEIDGKCQGIHDRNPCLTPWPPRQFP